MLSFCRAWRVPGCWGRGSFSPGRPSPQTPVAMTGPAPRAAGKRPDPGHNQAQEERPFARSKAPWLALGVLGEKEPGTRMPPHSRTAFPQSGAEALSFSYRRAAPKPPPPELRRARRAGSRARESYLRFRPRPPRAASPPPFPLGLRRPGLWPHLPPQPTNPSSPGRCALNGRGRAEAPGRDAASTSQSEKGARRCPAAEDASRRDSPPRGARCAALPGSAPGGSCPLGAPGLPSAPSGRGLRGAR